MRSKFKWIFTLLVAFTMQFSFAQEKTVTGTVSDDTGPLPSANVVVKETNRGVQTDIDGKYSIQVAAGQTLVFSFIGMADKEVKVGAANVINTKLEIGGEVLGEVVVTGALGIRKKQDAQTSSQQVVKAAEINQASQPNAALALVGKVSGLQINTTNSGVTTNTRVVLRGSRSMTGDNQALIVIDNSISSLNVFNAIPPEQIESVNVIKGAQGAALYGQDGSNGVIIVTTKRGSRGSKPVVSINSSVDFEEVSFVPQRQRRYGQGWSGQHVHYENGAWGAEFDGVMRPTGLAQADGSYIMAPYSSIKDNIKEFFQTGTILQNGVSVSAGDENGYATFSANRQTTDFVVEGDELNRNTFLFKGGKKMGKWSIDGIANYITQKVENTTSTLYEDLLQTATNIPVERFSSPFNQYHWTSYYRSPYWMKENIRNEARRDDFRGQIQLNYKFNDNINVNYNGNVVMNNITTLSYTNGYVDLLQVGGGDHTTISSFDNTDSGFRNIDSYLMLNFDYKLTDAIGFKLNLGNNVQDQHFRSTSVGGDNLTIPGFYNISNVPGIPRTANVNQRTRSYSVYANVDLDYKEYLFLNLTARNDWYSRLDPSNQSYFYPSAGVSFVPTKAFESLRDNKVVTHAKIMASIVRNGKASDIGHGTINDLYVQPTGYPFGDLNSFTPSPTTTYRYIEPEFYTTKEIGFNVEFWNGRLSLDASYFRSDNENLITGIAPSNTSGLTRVTTNISKAKTYGGEIDLGFMPIDTKDFGDLGIRWTNRLSLSSAKMKVLEVSDDADEVPLTTYAARGMGIYAVAGEEYPTIKGIGYERDDQGRVIIDSETGLPEKTSELIILGKSTPDYILAYNTGLEFKGFKLSAVMDYRTGHQYYSETKYWLSWSGHLYDSALTGRTGFIFPNSAIEDPNNPGQYIANTNVVTGGTSYGEYLSYYQDEYAETAENHVLDATAFKVRELALSYTFPSTMLERLRLSSLRIGVNARNPFMVLPRENRNYNDPEQNFSSTSNAQGLAVTGQYPLTRTYGFSVNLTF